MKSFETKDYKAFTMFEDRWALITAGTLDHFNTCTVSWGSSKNRWEPHYMYIGEVVEAIEG